MLRIRKGTCIGFLPDAGCGLIYGDEAVDGSHIVFVHFRDIEPKNGWQGLESRDRVEYVLDDILGDKFHRGHAASGPVISDLENGFVRKIEGDNDLDLQIFTKVPDEARLPSADGDVIFYGCNWDRKANFSNSKIQGDLVFLGCSFADSFTLKEAKVKGSVHMEGCDFSGAGGASFRGLVAKALYLDFGVKGPRDMVWLNEMCISGNVVIGGEFKGAIQVMRLQDNRVMTQTAMGNEKDQSPCFQSLYIGKEFYKSQNINRSILEGGLDVHGLTHGERIEIENTEMGELKVLSISGDVAVACRKSKVLGSVMIEGGNHSAAVKGMDFQDSYIEGHLSVKDINMIGVLNLDDATVERVVRLHHVRFQEGGGLKLARLSVNRFVMDDFNGLYGLKKGKKPVRWKNPSFKMLWREKQMQLLCQRNDARVVAEDSNTLSQKAQFKLRGEVFHDTRVELVQEYVLLKNLLSQEGQLRLEDEAFYNMRKLGHWYQDMGMLLFNYVFGWGVRLQNILLSGAVLMVMYSILYANIFSMRPMGAVQLSLQSMFMAFFGEIEPKIFAGSSLSWLVLSESVLGIIFVTVFVGAYVRKLLR